MMFSPTKPKIRFRRLSEGAVDVCGEPAVSVLSLYRSERAWRICLRIRVSETLHHWPNVHINKYIDDVVSEFQIQIDFIESSEKKQLAEDSIFRLEDFLSEYDINLSKIEMCQFESGNRHDYELYDVEELKDLKNTAGEIDILVYFTKHNN